MLYEPPPQRNIFDWVWIKWIYGFWQRFNDLASTATDDGAALVGNAVQIVSSKAVAAGITPSTTRNLYVVGSDGGLFYGTTGATAGTYSDDGGTSCGTVFIPTGGDGSTAWRRDGVDHINVRWFGAVGDGKVVSDGGISSGDTELTSASAAFTSADVGKIVGVQGAGAAGAYLEATIATYNSATSVELTASAGTTVSGATFHYGTNDNTAIASAISATWGKGVGATTYFPYSDGYCITSAMSIGNQSLIGETTNVGIFPSIMLIAADQECVDITNSSVFKIRHLSFVGPGQQVGTTTRAINIIRPGSFGTGVAVDDSSIADCWFTGFVEACIRTAHSQGNQFIDNYFELSGYGILATHATDPVFYKNIISRNRFFQCDENAISITGLISVSQNASLSKWNIITDNVIDFCCFDTQTNAAILLSNGANNNLVSNNSFSNNYGQDVSLSTSQGNMITGNTHNRTGREAVIMSDSDENMISGNEITSANYLKGTHAGTLDAIIAYNGGIDNVFRGNKIWSFSGENRIRYGINSETGMGNIVSGNDVSDYVTSAYAGVHDRLLQQNGADKGDADSTIYVDVDPTIVRYDTALTVNRTVTLSTTNARSGDTFRVVRTGLGAFTLDVGGLKTIPNATAAFVDVQYNGGAWVLTGYGTL